MSTVLGHHTKAPSVNVALSSVHTWCPGTVPKYGTHWALMWSHPFLQISKLELGHGAGDQVQGLNLLLGHHVHTFLVSCGQSTALFSVLSSCLKMAADRAKWSNYVHSHISGTQSVNTTPFCVVPRHWFQSTKCGQPLRFLMCSCCSFQVCEFMYIVIWYKRTVATFEDLSLRLLYQASEFKLDKFVDLFNVR